jgi:hypothetical protein
VFRLFISLHFLFFNLYACKGGYASCVQKAKDAKIIQKKSLYIPVQHQQLLVYTHNTPKSKIIKYDPFLSLYLTEDKKPFAYPYDINMRLQLGTAILNDKIAKEGRIVQNQVGLNSFAKYNQSLPAPAIISSSCCSLEAIVTDKGAIQKRYVQNFLNTKTALYGDIGIRVYDEGKLVLVQASDPFMKDNPFKLQDCIVMYDKKKVKNSALFMQKILFSPIGSKHTVTIKRGVKVLTFKVITKKRYGGGFLSDTFLEQKGIFFDAGLHVSKINKKFQNYGLKIGDKLIQVNGVVVKNQNEPRKYIENFKDYSSLLFERNKFQFFVNIK